MAEDRVIVDPREQAIRAGSYSRMADFQGELLRLARRCRGAAAEGLNPDPSGTVGPATSRVIRSIVGCPELANLPGASPAREGVITNALWRLVAPGIAEPRLQDRVDALVLSFEATDFTDKPEWNFCQDSSIGDRERARNGHSPIRCFNVSDPCSMLTWGPRGATAGQGREIQWVLWKILKSYPGMLERAFGAEFANVRRFVRLRGPPLQCAGDSPLEHFVCAVWRDPARRHAWEEGLVILGQDSFVRHIFQRLYASEEFDGYKLRAYYRLWGELGLQPSEIDYAFFYDRATHIGAPPEGLQSRELKMCADAESTALTAHAAARRCLSKRHRHPAQSPDREGRDIAFYVDGYAWDALGDDERKAWTNHIPLAAGRHFGLSDERLVPIEQVTGGLSEAADAPPQDSSQLTQAEKSCPLEIRAPVRSQPP